MKTREELDEFLSEFGLENCLYLSEEETIPAIVGYDDETRALIYDYDKLVEGFMEHFREDGKDEEELYQDAVDWVEFNTIRSLPYKHEGYVNPMIMHNLSQYEDYEDYCQPKPYEFDAKKETENTIKWIKDWFEENGKGCKAVLGMSGGKDSTIIAALCAKALGPENVIGVSMPDDEQGFNDADKICEYLGIRLIKQPIGAITMQFSSVGSPYELDTPFSEQAEQNIPPRIRMTMLYAIAQTLNGRVACCDNASEAYVGYSTLFGDNVGSFAPLKNYTVTEVRAIGDELGIPNKWVHKTPDDGLPHSCSDEEKFGFTYESLDKYIREGKWDDKATINKILEMHNKNVFKTQIVNIPSPKNDLPVF